MTYDVTQTSLGVADLSDNARLITENRFAFAANGDESNMCDDGSSTSAPTSAPTSGSCGNCVFPFIYQGRESDRCTRIDGDSTPWCATSVDSSGNMLTREYCQDSSCPGLQGNNPPMTVHPENAEGKCCKLLLYSLSSPHSSLKGVGSRTELTTTRTPRSSAGSPQSLGSSLGR